MAKKENIFVALTSEYDGKAFARAGKDMSALDKSIHKLGKAFLSVFAAQKLAAFGKSSVKAFIADEKAAKALSVQLNNLGYSLSAPGVELYIASLQKMYGVLDDDLRPAFQTLITASGSLVATQKALGVALNISAATGKSLEEVSAALAKGFSGQTTALSRLGAGLDKATLASGDMNKILDALNEKFAGQAAARLDTYAGKMDALKVASANASEIIGQSLIQSIEALGNTTDISKITSQMESFATEVGFAITEISKLIGLLNTPIVAGKGILGILGEILFPGGNPFRAGAKIRDKDKKYPGGSGFTYDASGSVAGAQAKQTELDNLKKRNSLNTKILAQDKSKLALNELSNKFDIERINLQVALASATDEETKLRIKAKLALLDQDSALAALYNKQLDAAAAASKFAAAASQAADKLFNAFENASNYGAFRESPYVPGAAVASAGNSGTTVVNNFNAPTFDTQQKINQMVQQATLENNVSLGITAPAGFL
jgi:hypothetical protein